MSTSKRGIESDQFPCAEENHFDASRFIKNSKSIFSGNSNQNQHNLPTRAFTPSQNDDDQQRRSDQQTCISHEGLLSTASSTAASTSDFHSLMVRLATDDFPEYVKRNRSALTFPEKVRDPNSLFARHIYIQQTLTTLMSCILQMMMLMVYVERISARLGKRKGKESIEWTADGKSFVIWHVKDFTSSWLHMFFGKTKFSSFTRKLYRWGFRQIKVCVSIKAGQCGRVLCFGNENFQRNDMTLLTKMLSITAEKHGRQKPRGVHSSELHQSIMSEASAYGRSPNRHNATPMPSQQPVVGRCTSGVPDSHNHFLVPKKWSKSRAGLLSLETQCLDKPIDSNGNAQTSSISLGVSAPPEQSHHRREKTRQQLEKKSVIEHPTASTYEEQLVARVIFLYQSQHNLSAI